MDAWRMIADVTGSRRPWRTAGGAGMFLAGRLGDLVAWVRGIEGDINSAAVGMSKLEHHFTYARAASELGYKPRPVREGVEAGWKWFVDHGYAKAKKK
jgi:dihydroflavonol-4-reductase